MFHHNSTGAIINKKSDALPGEFRLRTNPRTILILALMICLTELIVFWKYIFGGHLLAFYDIGSDTAQQYIPLYTSVVNKLRAGDRSLWDSKNAFGINMFLMNLTNPVLDIVYLIGVIAGPEIIPYLMLPLYLIQILSGGILCYLFISAFSFDERSKLLASYMYAFNGFMIVWGQHYQFAIVCTLLPLELLMTERYIRDRKKWKALVITTFIVVINSMYMAYMMLIFTGFYVLIRLFMRPLRGFLRYVKDVLRAALIMLTGVLLGAFSLIPSAAAIALVSNRLESRGGMLDRLFGYKFPMLYFATLGERMLSSTVFGVSEYMGYLNYYEGPCLFFTALFPILAVQYIFIIPKTSRSRKVKVLEYILIAAAVFSAVTPAVGVMFNGFTVRFCRWMYLYFIYFALIAAETLDCIFKEKKVNIPGLILSAAFIAAAGIWGNRSNNVHHPYVIYGAMLFGILMCLVLFIFGIRSRRAESAADQKGGARAPADGSAGGGRRSARAALCMLILLVFASASLDTCSNFTDRQTVDKGSSYFEELYHKDSDTNRAIAWIKNENKGVFRIEKTYNVLDGTDSLIEGYRSVSGYNSTQNANILEYINDFWGSLWYRDTNHTIYAIGADNGSYGNQGAFCGVRYLLSETEDPEIPGYSVVKRFGNVYVLKYREECGIATLYPENSGTISGDDLAVNYADHMGYDGIKISDAGRDDMMSGTVTVGSDAFLVTTVPYEAGWSVYADGSKQELFCVNRGFIGIRLSPGTHEIKLQYRCPGFGAGCAVSAAALIIFIALIAAERIMKSNGKKKEILSRAADNPRDEK